MKPVHGIADVIESGRRPYRIVHCAKPRAAEKIQGFTLIEVLITLIVLSVGLLGVAGLQATSLRTNHSSYLRSQAVELINDMSDRMRANKSGVDSNQYASISATPNAPDYDCMTDFTNTVAAGECSAAETATYDTYSWRTAVAGALPSGTGTVICTDSNDLDAIDNGFTDDADNNGIHDTGSDADACTTGSAHIITISWDDNRSGAADTNFSVVFTP